MTLPPAASTRESAAGPHRSTRALLALGLFKLSKAALLIAIGVLTLAHHGHGLADGTHHLVATLHLDPGNHVVHGLLTRVTGIEPRTLHRLAVGTFVYAALFLVEGFGLVRAKRWGEIVSIVITSSFVPLEVYECVRHLTWVRVLGTLLNVATVVYLVVRVHRERREQREQRTHSAG